VTVLAAEQLKRRLARGRDRWPIDWERQVRARVLLWASFRESEDTVIRKVADVRPSQRYYIDPLAPKLSEAYGSMLFGQDPELRASASQDQQRLDDLAQANALPSQLQEGVNIAASEGEVWWRLSVNLEALDHPILSWHSRADVVPLLHGRVVVGVAFVFRLESLSGGPDDKSDSQVFRHVEVNTRGRVENLLYLGRNAALGQAVDLGRHVETMDLNPVWDHGLPSALGGRIVNKPGRNAYVGLSEYLPVWNLLLLANDAMTIGAKNLKLTGKKRAVVPASAVRKRAPSDDELEDRGDGTFDRVRPPTADWSDEDILVSDPLDVDEGTGERRDPFRVLEYSFDAAALVLYQRFIVETICARCDIVPQFIGQGEFGSAESGTALRVRLLPTVNAAESRARYWDDEVPRILMLMQLLESMSQSLGGVGRPWSDAAGRPIVQRQEPLPEDPTDQATRHSTLKTSQLLSTETSLRERYPDWSDEDLAAEVERIRGDVQNEAPQVSFAGVGGGGPGPAPVPPPTPPAPASGG
jgi:hypothetical protein